MSNVGLKPYAKYIEINYSSFWKAYINVNKDDANLLMVFNLIDIEGPTPINISAIYNYNKKDEARCFGKGIFLNLFKDFNCSGTSNDVEVLNSDGSLAIYKHSNDYFNKEDGLTCTPEQAYSQQQGTYLKYKFEDKVGDVIYYSDLSPYPTTITFKNGNNVTITNGIAGTSIYTNYNDNISLTKNTTYNRYEYIAYSRNNITLYEIEFDYDNNNRLRHIYKYKGNSLISTITITYNSSDIIVFEDNTRLYTRFIFSNDRVISYYTEVDDSHLERHQFYVEYDEKITTLKDWLNRKQYIIFNEQNLPIVEMDEYGNAFQRDYDKETKSLIYEGLVINYNDSILNLLGTNSLVDFTNNGVSLASEVYTNTLFTNWLGNSLCRANNYDSVEHTLTKEISFKGIASDKFLVAFWFNQYTHNNDNNYVKVKILLSNGESEEAFIDSYCGNDLFHLFTFGILAHKSFTSVKIIFTFYGRVNISIGGIKLIKKEFGSTIEYDNKNNIKRTSSAKGENCYEYSNGLMVESTDQNGCIYFSQYDEFNRLISAKNPYGSVLENTYDSTHKQNLIKTEFYKSDYSTGSERSYQYTSDGRLVKKIIDELDNEYINSTFDNYDNVLSSIIEDNTHYSFSYTSYNQLWQLSINESGYNDYNSISYDSALNIDELTSANGTHFSFIYSEFFYLTNIYINNNLFYKTIYDYHTNLISKKLYNNASGYKYEYNDYLLSKISFINDNNQESTRYVLYYDNSRRLEQIYDSSTLLTTDYSYDSDGRLIDVDNGLSNFNFLYDNSDNLSTSIYKIGSCRHINFYDSLNRSIGVHPEAFFLGIPNLLELGYVATYAEDAALKDESTYFLPYNEDFTLHKLGIIPYINTSSSKLLKYKIVYNHSGIKEHGCIMFWFKNPTPVSGNTMCLFSVKSETTLDKVYANIESDKVKLYVRSTAGSQLILTSDYYIIQDQWNFVAFDFFFYSSTSNPQGEFGLCLNGHVQKVLSNLTIGNVYLGYNSEYIIYNIGHNVNITGLPSDKTNMSVSALYIAKRRQLDLKEVYDYYRISRDYIFENECITGSIKTVDFSSGSHITIGDYNYNLFDIYPLNNSVFSLKKNKPEKFDIRPGSSFDKDRCFSFDKDLMKYVFVLDGNILTFKPNFNYSGTILLHFKINSEGELNYMLEGVYGSTIKLALYRNNNGYLVFKFDTFEQTKNIFISCNEWHYLAFSFERVIICESLGDYRTDFRIIYDNNCYNYSINTYFSMSNLELYIGRKKSVTYSYYYIDDLGTYYPLLGEIENLCFADAYCETSTILNLINELQGSSAIKEYDTLGKFVKYDIIHNNNRIIESYFDYKRKSYDYNQISNYISSNKIYGPNNTTLFDFSYETNNLGKVTKIYNQNILKHTYTYDRRGYLIGADGTTFSYDNNGNITNIGSMQLTYDSVIKDRLVQFGNKTVLYQGSNPFYPSKYGDIELVFEGRRLVQIVNEYNDDFEYKYDINGLRISKIRHNNETFNYFYEGDKLVTEVGPTYRFDFLYDADGQLYGFIIDNEDKYYYVRDALLNIVGIVDESGTLVVQYEYSPFGKVVSITGSLANTIGQLNPFRFKGYYYDEETGFYYLKTRYYDPNIGRFISPDSIEYLDPSSISGLNLYIYCNDDPINTIDLNGHAPAWLQIAGWIGFGIGVILCSVAIGILVSGVSTVTLIGATAVGAAKGALVGAGIGIGAGAIIGGSGAIIFGEEFGSNEFWSDVCFGAMTGFGVGSIIGAIFGGFVGANSRYSAKALEFTNSGSSEVFLGKNPTYFNIAQQNGGTSFHVSDIVRNSTANMRGVNMWKINKAFLKQQIALGNRFIFTSYDFTGMFAREVAYVMKHGIWAFLV